MKRILLTLMTMVCVCTYVCAQDIVNLRQDAQSQCLRYKVASVDEDVLVRKEFFREDWPERKWFRDDLRNCLREESGNIYAFDLEGRMTSHTYTLRGAKLRTTTCAYQNGRLSSLVGEGCIVKRNGNDLDIYAESGTYASERLDGRKGDYAFDLKCRMEWADDGQLLASRYYYVDSTPAKAYEYQYNHRGLVTEMVALAYAAHGKVASKMVTRYQYDNNDCLAKMTVRGEGIDDVYTYENNAEGDPIKMTYSTPFSTTIYDYEYRYDESGNWTMRLQWKDGVFENAVLRTITYHKGGDAPGVALAQTNAEKAEAERVAKDKAKAEKAQAREQAKADKPSKEDKAQAKADRAKSEAQYTSPSRKEVIAEAKAKAQAEREARHHKAKPAKQPKSKPVKQQKQGTDIPDELK